MKEDHMRNGQLKPGYNMQIAVNSEYITGVAAYPNRSDSVRLSRSLKRWNVDIIRNIVRSLPMPGMRARITISIWTVAGR